VVFNAMALPLQTYGLVLELLAEEAAHSLFDAHSKRASAAVLSAALICVFEKSHLVLARLMSSVACSACCRCQEEG
jgi:hypothetical protein